MQSNWDSHTLLWNGPATLETLQFITKLNLHFPYEPAIPLLDTYPRETKTYVLTNTYMQIFIAALFIIIKELKCAWTSEQMNYYIHTMEQYLATFCCYRQKHEYMWGKNRHKMLNSVWFYLYGSLEKGKLQIFYRYYGYDGSNKHLSKL